MSAIVPPKVNEEDQKHKLAAATHVGERPPKVDIYLLQGNISYPIFRTVKILRPLQSR